MHEESHMSVTKNEVTLFLQQFDIHFSDVTAFLINDCRLERGFEAQIPGLQSTSPTTSGIVTYVLNKTNELSKNEQSQLIDELLSFQVGNSWADSEFVNQKYTNIWATSQCLLGLLSMDTFDHDRVHPTIRWLCREQGHNGGWSFSGHESEKLIYHPYPILVLTMYEGGGDLDIDGSLQRAKSFAANYTPKNETEKILQRWCVEYLDTSPPSAETNIDYAEILKREFADYVIQEHSIYPFSLKYFTPANYLLTRRFMSPTHPFNIWLIKYLIEHQIDGRGWTHVNPIRDPRDPDGLNDESTPFSYCTALAIFTLYMWGQDMLMSECSLSEFPSWDHLVSKLEET